jgi:biopolymer transport protein ExbD
MRKRFRSLPDDDSSEEPLVNLTPLIDVVFVVLITFMLIAPVLDIDPVSLAQSGGSEKKELQAGPISIAVHADNTLWYQGKKVTLTDLDKILRQEKKRQPKAIPQLVHDKQASFGTYQSLKNMLEAIGFEQMDVILKPGQ